MELPSWQERLAEDIGEVKAPTLLPFADTRKLFAVDASASTRGKIMAAQRDFVLELHSDSKDVVCKWDCYCESPCAVSSVSEKYFSGSGGTQPTCILETSATVDQIKDSDLWILLTDGEIYDREVVELTRLAEEKAITQIPVILLIVGGNYSTPDRENISVGVSFFASARDALILYKSIRDGALFVIDAKGVFTRLRGVDVDLSDWSKLPRFASENTFKKEFISLDISFDPDRRRRQQKGISLGPKWDAATGNILVKVSNLLSQHQIALQDIHKLLEEEAITRLALTCKTRGQLHDLHDLLVRHKQQEVLVRLEDRNGAAEIMEKIQATRDIQEKDRLGENLRQAHAANRSTYQALKDSPSEDTKRISELNRLIDRGLRIISGFEKSSYTADILNRKSNRAMRSQVVSTADTGVKLAALDLSDNIKACRGACSICCGDEEIMSVTLKRLATVEENTTDFALNFPLAAAQAKQNADMISSQSVCFQCALLLERSIFQEDIVATLPTVDYSGPNKPYIIYQLYLAITAGLATGASGVVQLFATILDRTLESKSWCAKDADGDPEIRARRQVLEWTLNSMLKNCPCRENFTETGKWVRYPQALEYAAREFKEVGLDSWIIQYPIAGFSQLMRWYELLGLGVEEDHLVAIRYAKLINLVTSQILDGLLKTQDRDKEWTFPFLSLIYKEFNAPGVPRDLGQLSLISSDLFWDNLGNALDASQWSDVRRFLDLFRHSPHKYTIERIQLVVFWALYTQGHSKPKTFFANLKLREPLAVVILDTLAKVPVQPVRETLLSIFCPGKRTEEVFVLHDTGPITPFVSPYGPSVLQCGQPGCGARFYNHTDARKENMHLIIREGRAKHLSDVFGVEARFASQTGLPENTIAPKAPSSHHNTLHISTARTWARLDRPRRREVMDAIENGHEDVVKSFILDVRHELCARSHRGNIYSARIDSEVREVLPSFIAALRTASRKAGLEEHQGGVTFEHDWTQNTIIWKMEYELGLGDNEL